jgi:hypothetical protein
MPSSPHATASPSMTHDRARSRPDRFGDQRESLGAENRKNVCGEGRPAPKSPPAGSQHARGNNAAETDCVAGVVGLELRKACTSQVRACTGASTRARKVQRKVSQFTLFRMLHGKAYFCDVHHIPKSPVGLACPVSIRLIGAREIAMTTTNDFFASFISADAAPLERRTRSVWHLLFEKIMEGRMRKAEREINEYLRRNRRDPECQSRNPQFQSRKEGQRAESLPTA